MAKKNDKDKSGPVPVSALPPEAQEKVKQELEQQADKSPSQSFGPEPDAVMQALPNNLIPVLVHAGKVGVCALVDDLALGVKTVDLGAASAVVNMLAGNIAAAIKAWVNSLNYPAPGPAPYYPQPQPGPGPYYPPQPAPGPAPTPQPYYPPQPGPAPAPAPAPQPYYPPQPPAPPQPQPYYPPRPPGVDINAR